MTMRPPNRSVQIPSGRRNKAPVSTGVAVSKPNSDALSPSSLRIGMPVTPNISQAAKQTANANVLTSSTLIAMARGMGGAVSMVRLSSLGEVESAPSRR